MFTTGSKYFLGLGVLACVAFAVSMFFANPSALGATALIGLVGALTLLAGVILFARDGDVGSGEVTGSTNRRAPASMWPLISAAGLALLLIGTITQPVFFLFGIVVLVAAFVEWMVLSWSESASSDDEFNAGIRKRLLNPIEFPVLGAVGLGLLIFSFSRVMLAVDSRVGVALFIIIGALLIVGGVLVAMRPTLKQGLVTAICALAAIAIVGAGVSAAQNGMRSDLVAARFESDHGVQRECGATATEHGDTGVTQTISSVSGVNATVEFVDGELHARVQGMTGVQKSITIPRSSPSNIIFRNFDSGRFRLVAHLGTKQVTEGVVEEVVACTQLIESGAEQLLTLSIPKSSAANGPYSLSIAGIDDQSIDLVVP